MVIEIYQNGLFPIGIWSYLIGGLLIGFGVSFVYLFTGITAGVSRFLTNTLSYFSDLTYFHEKDRKDSRNLNVFLAIGLMMGAFIFTYTVKGGVGFVTGISWWQLVIGGFLVGIGTRLGRGCTSGHGICGSSSGSLASIVATCIFLGVAILTSILINSVWGIGL